MTVGVVPVLSKVAGHEDLILNGYNGFLFDDQEDLTNTLLKIACLPEGDIESLSNNAKIVPKEYCKISRSNLKRHFEKYE